MPSYCTKCRAILTNTTCMSCGGTGRKYVPSIGNTSYSSFCGMCNGTGSSSVRQCDKCTAEGITNFFSMVSGWVFGKSNDKS
jgi:DnaJ-class molecular chaperone